MDLFDLTPSLQRAVAPPGEFGTYFPNTSDEDLAGTLADALAEAQLDGFLQPTTLNSLTYTATPDLTSAQQALVVLYARARVITARLANLRNRARYKAGPVESETEQSASVLVALLKDTSERKKQILADARSGYGVTSFAMVDMYVTKSLDSTDPDLRYLTAIEAY